jgi:hypothetical protein
MQEQDYQKEISDLKRALEMERELYVNIRELSKSQDRKINTLKKAYDMQIDLVKALEEHIDKLVKTI